MKPSRSAGLLAILCATLALACQPTDVDGRAKRRFIAEMDSTCQFDTTGRFVSPTALTRDFVQRASRAEFASAEPWLAKATSCPGHEPGPDSFAIADSVALAPLDSSADSVRMILRRSIIGENIGGRFRPAPAWQTDTIVTHHTPFGWRIDNPVWNWSDVAAARERNWLADTVTQ